MVVPVMTTHFVSALSSNFDFDASIPLVPPGRRNRRWETCRRVAATHLLAVLQHALFGPHAALGPGRVGLPASGLDVDVHVELPAEHGHLRLSHRKSRARIGC